MDWRGLRLGVACAAVALALAACSAAEPGQPRGQPPPGAPPPAGPARSARPAPPGGLPSAPPREPLRPAPRGIYFLHAPDAAVEGCTFVGERHTGAAAPLHRPAAEQARANAVLDLAAQARREGANVVVLPRFDEDYQQGRLTGRVYRCDEAHRRALFQRAARRRQLTVLPE